MKDALSLRRADMLKLEKIATDIKEADDLLSGQKSPIPVLSNLVRRLERKIPEAEELITPVVKSLDEALHALATAQEGIEAAMRALDFEPDELEQIEERLLRFAVLLVNIKFLRMSWFSYTIKWMLNLLILKRLRTR